MMNYGYHAEKWSSAFRKEEKPTTRRAWDEVRDYTQREIQSREAMVAALREDVVRELMRLKVSGDTEFPSHSQEIESSLTRIRRSKVG
jgi:hypothetical protein